MCYQSDTCSIPCKKLRLAFEKTYVLFDFMPVFFTTNIGYENLARSCNRSFIGKFLQKILLKKRLQIWKAKTIAIAIAAVAILSFPCLFFELTAAVEYYYIGPDQMTDYFIDGTVIYVGGGSFVNRKAVSCRIYACSWRASACSSPCCRRRSISPV